MQYDSKYHGDNNRDKGNKHNDNADHDNYYGGDNFDDGDRADNDGGDYYE